MEYMKTEKKRQVILKTEVLSEDLIRIKLEVNALGEKLENIVEYTGDMRFDWSGTDHNYDWVKPEEGAAFESVASVLFKTLGLDTTVLYEMLEEIWEAKKCLELEESFVAEIY